MRSRRFAFRIPVDDGGNGDVDGFLAIHAEQSTAIGG
jgi:hypothetical protein